jgi:phenylalanyl-tRNA synthetase alpha chain
VATADDIAQLKARALADTAAADSLAALDEVRVLHTGRRSALTEILASIGTLPAAERGVVGKAANIARREIETALTERKATLEAAELTEQLANDRTDVTLPGDPYPRGALHLLTQVRLEIEEIFLALGYEIAAGPEVETEHYNFTALNTPEGHPARSSSDTFYVDGSPGTILRTQTSSVQVRVMEGRTPPLYVISPGAVYRRDDVDATHSPMFHQLEGLAVDEGLSLAHLIGTLKHVAGQLLGSTEYRIIPDFFPFTEPSIQLLVRWTDRSGRTSWMELLGAGMVDPNVFAFAGYDSERWTGFAFGMGLDRIAMVRHGVPDLRMLFDGDLRFLEQFA